MKYLDGYKRIIRCTNCKREVVMLKDNGWSASCRCLMADHYPPDAIPVETPEQDVFYVEPHIAIVTNEEEVVAFHEEAEVIL